jgi:hypothetical protein
MPQGCLVSTTPIGKIPQVRILGEDSAHEAEVKPNVGVAPNLFCFLSLLLFFFNVLFFFFLEYTCLELAS